MSYSLKKVKYWREILQQYVSSGLTPVEFCRHHSLSSKSFYKWRIRLSDELPKEKRSDVSGLLLAQVIPEQVSTVSGPPRYSENDSGLSIETGGMTLRLSTGFDAATFLRVLELIGERSC